MSATPPLAPEDTARLTDFARTCRAAARAVVLYPDGHPAITSSLRRLEQVTSAAELARPLEITVLAETLCLHGRAPAKPDAALGELAVILHAHLVGQLTVHPGGTADAWRDFLRLLGRDPGIVRGEGGISRLWTAAAGRHVELKEIDYAEVLRERDGDLPEGWHAIISACLQGPLLTLDDETLTALLDAAGDPDRLAGLLGALDARSGNTASGGPRAAALLRLLDAILTAIDQHAPDRADRARTTMAAAVGQLPPEALLALITGAERTEQASGIVSSVVGHMTDAVVAGFVARHAIGAVEAGPDARGPALDRLAQAFHALVGDPGHRERLLAMAREEAAATPAGASPGFEDTWDTVARQLLTSYSDQPFVPDPYAQELSAAQARAVAVEHTQDDPPERVAQWIGTVATSRLRQLDVTLVLDLVRLEEDETRRETLAAPIIALVEDLLLVGDFESASDLVGAMAADASPGAAAVRRPMAAHVLDRLAGGALMPHLLAHLPTMDDAQLGRITSICVAIGEAMIRPLAEALSAEERVRPRERLTAILLAFGALGRREAERLKGSPNPAVRRAAVYLLREFGGSEALPELTELMNDREPQVQREAVRAILNIGTQRAYDVLEQALARGTPETRNAIMQSVAAVRDERAALLFAHVLRHIDHRGALRLIYLQAIELLGSLRHPEGVAALRDALYRGEWWAPRRTARLRAAAATALARIGTPDATVVLEDAARSGPRGVRSAVRAAWHGNQEAS